MRIASQLVVASCVVLVLAAGCGGSEEGGGDGGGNGASSSSSASSSGTTPCDACANAEACCQAGASTFHVDGGACAALSVANCNAQPAANQSALVQDCETTIQTGKTLGIAACH